jgi:hypothetical protein
MPNRLTKDTCGVKMIDTPTRDGEHDGGRTSASLQNPLRPSPRHRTLLISLSMREKSFRSIVAASTGTMR